MLKETSLSRPGSPARLLRPILWSVLLGALSAPWASASLWESSSWALTGDLAAELAYDSNIFGRADGDSDVSLTATPALHWKRKGSVTRLDIDLSADFRHFFEYDDQDAIDPSLRITYRYPETEETLTSHQIDFVAESRSSVNLNVGDRTSWETLRGVWFGTLRDTGKTQVLGRVGSEYVDYSDWGTKNLDFFAGLGLGWLRTELMQLYVNYDFEYEDVTSTRSGVLDSDRTSHGINFGVRGELSPKMEGSANFGVRNIRFSGGINRSGWDWFADADLTWRLHERQSFSITASRRNRFDPNGNPYNDTYFRLSMYQGITTSLSGNIGIGWSSFGYIDDEGNISEERRDDMFQVSASLNYRPSARFEADCRIEWYNKDSNSEIYTFNRTRLSLRASYHF
ncbi:MAG: DUF560 domain-containing protein [Verrucomicrobia bacterium]|nr:MAG: DUF560 domain-containing protein [Verrucomicrobiota bacterium]